MQISAVETTAAKQKGKKVMTLTEIRWFTVTEKETATILELIHETKKAMLFFLWLPTAAHLEGNITT